MRNVTIGPLVVKVQYGNTVVYDARQKQGSRVRAIYIGKDLQAHNHAVNAARKLYAKERGEE